MQFGRTFGIGKICHQKQTAVFEDFWGKYVSFLRISSGSGLFITHLVKPF
jgi:hypothetical protein